MQTFLPYSDFGASARVLDRRRLGKQRVETLQILRALTFDDYGWRTHPAVTMWGGYTAALVGYGVAVSDAWVARGHTDTVRSQLVEFVAPEPPRPQAALARAGRLPPWLGWEPLHRSHRAALLRKDPAHYGAVFGDVDSGVPYVWPDAPPLPPPRGVVTGWVVRATPAQAVAMRAGGFVGLRPVAGEGPDAPEGGGTRDTKRRRQIRAFVSEVEAGDRVVVPGGDRLLVGEVTGAYGWSPDAPDGLCHRRPVRWLGAMARSDLAQPVHLQDPRVVFALRDEPAVAAFTGGG